MLKTQTVTEISPTDFRRADMLPVSLYNELVGVKTESPYKTCKAIVLFGAAANDVEINNSLNRVPDIFGSIEETGLVSHKLFEISIPPCMTRALEAQPIVRTATFPSDFSR